jgi:hypothetical protein
MARQEGPIKITGTIGNLTFYKMNGNYYVKKKSSLNRNKVLKSPKFERTRTHAGEFELASPTASKLYWSIPKENRYKGLYQKMVGRAKTLLHQGKSIEEVKRIIMEEVKCADVLMCRCADENAKIKSTEVCRMNVDNRGRLLVKNAKCKIKNEKSELRTSPAPYGALLEEIIKLRECLAPYSAWEDLRI